MPNWISNNITLSGNEEDLKKIKELVKSEHSEFDFNKIIKCPDELNDNTSPLHKKEGETDKDFKEKRRRFIKEYGSDNWYDWCIYNWGTKWNASNDSLSYEGLENISFDTAWSTPMRVLIKLSEMFPKVKIEVDYADEDLGNNCGTYVLLNGEEISYEEKDLKFAAEMQGYSVGKCSKCGKEIVNYEELPEEELVCYECENK